jgi:hypothetical protein
MFRTVPLSRSFSLYTQQWQMSYRFADNLQAGSEWNWVPSWKTPDDGQRNCLKHVEFHSKNKFEKLVHLVGFIIRNLTQCTITWPSNNNPLLPKYSVSVISVAWHELHKFYFSNCLCSVLTTRNNDHNFHLLLKESSFFIKWERTFHKLKILIMFRFLQNLQNI